MEKQNRSKPTKVRCSSCGYEWTTMSNAIMVTCPNCIRKTMRNIEEVLKE